MTQWVWDRIARIASGTSFIILFGFFVYLQLGYFHPRVSSYPPNTTFDGNGPYRPSEAVERLGKLLPEQRHSYLIAEVTEDLFFPIVYSLMFAVAIAAPGRVTKWRWLIILPFATAAFDYLENATVIAMILLYNSGKSLGVFPYIGTFATTVKSGLFLASGLIAIWLTLRWIIRKPDVRVPAA